MSDPSAPPISSYFTSLRRAIDPSRARRAPELIAELQRDRITDFHRNCWGGPIGVLAAAWIYGVLAADSLPPSRRWGWVGLMTIAAIGMVVAFAVPAVARHRSADGIPRLSRFFHLLVGIGFGSILWLDLDTSRDPAFRWMTLTLMAAVAAGAGNGLAGINDLGRRVILPMWFLAATALVAVGQEFTAFAVAVFLALSWKDMIDSQIWWEASVEIRMRAADAAAQFARDALHDPLTSVLNRTGLLSELRLADEELRPVTGLFIDLDHFKEVNDRFGHMAGDEVLGAAARRIRRSLRRCDIIGRLGGDEFFVLIDRSSQPLEPAAVDRLVSRIISSLEQPIALSSGEDAYISASVGIAELQPGGGADALLNEADHALYRAKQSGRRQLVRFDDGLAVEVAERVGLESSLRASIRRGEIDTAMQPVFDIESGRVLWVELLARWEAPDGTRIAPDIFIPMAESIGLIDDLTELMLETAGRLMHEWVGDPLFDGAKVSVNVSPTQIDRRTLVPAVSALIEGGHIDPHRLVLEITESANLSDVELELEGFEVLHQLGVQFAVDDFGTGYSSLSRLLALPFGAIKIDRELVAGLTTDIRVDALVRSIQQLSSIVGYTVIAEGVENDEQLEHLRRLGVPGVQGYHLCRPVGHDQLRDRVRDWGIRRGDARLPSLDR